MSLQFLIKLYILYSEFVVIIIRLYLGQKQFLFIPYFLPKSTKKKKGKNEDHIALLYFIANAWNVFPM